eukprot:SAG11_NODE_4050_length_2086_cov_2.008556_2_plen_43_part_00
MIFVGMYAYSITEMFPDDAGAIVMVLVGEFGRCFRQECASAH